MHLCVFRSYMTLYAIIPILLFLVGLLLIRKYTTKKVAPFPEAWKPLLAKHVHFYSLLSDAKKTTFQQRIMRFLSQVVIDGVGLEIEALDRILIAASAVIPVFSFKNWRYTNLSGIILYPDYFNEDLEFGPEAKFKHIAGMVGTGRFEKQMILSKKALYHGFANKTDKGNTAIHEFVHLIDKMDGKTDGIPKKLIEHQYIVPWLKLIHKEMRAINNYKSDIRMYGGTNEAEFFAVASEYFFERPKLLKRKHPELYKLLHRTFIK